MVDFLKLSQQERLILAKSLLESVINDITGMQNAVEMLECLYKRYDTYRICTIDLRDFKMSWSACLQPQQLPSAQPEHALKDCRNCKHGQYNDHWDTYFCYNSGNCEDWNLWESDIIPSAQPDRSLWFRIGELCVDESKGNITAEVAIEKIRVLLREERRTDE